MSITGTLMESLTEKGTSETPLFDNFEGPHMRRLDRLQNVSEACPNNICSSMLVAINICGQCLSENEHREREVAMIDERVSNCDKMDKHAKAWESCPSALQDLFILTIQYMTFSIFIPT